MTPGITKPLRVTYSGGPHNGVTYMTQDDQVPAVVLVPGWKGLHRYRATGKVYDYDADGNGLLVSVTYRHEGEG